MPKHNAKPSVENLPKLLLKLSKISEDIAVGSDKGFDETSADFPNINDVVTPMEVNNSKTCRFSKAQTVSEITITTKRLGCETVLKCV